MSDAMRWLVVSIFCLGLLQVPTFANENPGLLDRLKHDCPLVLLAVVGALGVRTFGPDIGPKKSYLPDEYNVGVDLPNAHGGTATCVPRA